MMRPPYLPLMGGESTSEAAQGKDAYDLPDISAKSQRTLDSPFRAEVSQLVWALARRPEPRCFDYPRGILGYPEMVTEGWPTTREIGRSSCSAWANSPTRLEKLRLGLPWRRGGGPRAGRDSVGGQRSDLLYCAGCDSPYLYDDCDEQEPDDNKQGNPQERFRGGQRIEADRSRRGHGPYRIGRSSSRGKLHRYGRYCPDRPVWLDHRLLNAPEWGVVTAGGITPGLSDVVLRTWQ